MIRFLRLFHHLILRDLAANPGRTALTLTGVALGIAVVVGVHLANERAINSFDRSLAILNGQADLQISANGLDLDESLVGDLSWVWDVGLMTAIVEGRMDLPAPTGTEGPFRGRDPVRVFGVDLLSDAPFRTYLLEEGGGELGLNIARAQFLELLVEPNAVILPAALSEELNAPLGGSLSLLVGNRSEDFVVKAVLEDTGVARAFEGRIVFMDIAAAQWMLGRTGKIDRIEVLLADPERADIVAERIRAQLPPSIVVARPDDLRDQTERITRAFRYNLRALSYIALIVGMILIYNTLNISVIRRRGEIGSLRTLGTSRRTLLWMFLTEAALFGVVGAGIGIGLGEVLSRASGALVSQTISMLYTGTPASAGDGAFDGTFYALIVLLGTVLAMASGAGPAMAAMRVAPVATIRNAGFQRPPGALPRWLGVSAIGVGVLLCFAPALDGFPFLGYLAGLMFIAGFGLLSPDLARLLLYGAGKVAKRALPAEGLLASQTIEGSLGRVVVAVMSLAIAVAMLSSVAIMVASFRDTVIVWVDQTLQGDLYLRPLAPGDDNGRNAFGSEAVESVSSVPGVAAIDRFRAIGIDYDGFPAILGAGEFATLAAHSRLLFMNGEETRAVARRLIGSDRVVVSEPFAVRHGVRAGDTIQLPTPNGLEPFAVEALFYDYSTEGGLVVMDRSTYLSKFDDTAISNVAVYLESGADADSVRRNIAAGLSGVELRIATNGELRAQVLRVFDQTFQVTYALEAIALAVAMLGIANTLAALMLERRGELAMLRFIGASRQQIKRVIVLESGLIGVLGGLIGLGLGVVLSLLLVYVINFQSFGWTIQFTMPGGFLLQSLAVVLLATMGAGLYPAGLALKMEPIDGIRAD